MICEKPRVKALALGSTVAIVYTLCAITFALFPTLPHSLLNGVNHGLEFKTVGTGNVSFTFGSYLMGLFCITLYGMITGYIYGVVNNFFQSNESEFKVNRKVEPSKT